MDDCVTILMPLYNGAAFLSEALDDAVRQTHRRLRILVVDDGSTDASPEIVRRRAADDNRIRLVRNDRNLGLVGNWNRCLQLADTPWVKFHFQDDRMHPECVATLLQLAQRHAVRMTLSARRCQLDGMPNWQQRHLARHHRTIADRLPHETVTHVDQVRAELLRSPFGNWFGEPITALMHRDLFTSYGPFFPALRQLCDLEFFARVMTGEAVVTCRTPLVTFRVHGGSQTGRFAPTAASLGQLERTVLGERYLTSPAFAWMPPGLGGRARINRLAWRAYYRACSHAGAQAATTELLTRCDQLPTLERYRCRWPGYLASRPVAYASSITNRLRQLRLQLSETYEDRTHHEASPVHA